MMDELNTQVRDALEVQRQSFSEAIVALQYQRQPELLARYGEAGRAKCLQDAASRLSFLAQALAVSRPLLFADYLAWEKITRAGYGTPAEDLALSIVCIRDVLHQVLPEEIRAPVREYIDIGLTQLPQLPSVLPTFMSAQEPLADLAQYYIEALLRGERHSASHCVLEAAKTGVSIKDLYLHVFQRTQYEIGRLWQMNQISVAQEHYCTAATQLIMSQLYPSILATKKKPHVLVASCVSNELHEIGGRMVADFLEMDGWNTFYIGANTPTPSIVQTLEEQQANVLSISATLTSHIQTIAEVIAAVRSSEVGQHVKILVGGRPFNIVPDLWQQVGADASARDASEAVTVANPARPKQ